MKVSEVSPYGNMVVVRPNKSSEMKVAEVSRYRNMMKKKETRDRDAEQLLKQ